MPFAKPTVTLLASGHQTAGVFVPIDLSKLSPSSRQQIAASRAQRDPDRIGRHATAAILGVTIRTLQRWHNQGFGPPRRNNPGERPIWYSRTEVEEWAALHGYPK